MNELTKNRVRMATLADAASIARLEETCFSCPYNEAAVTDLLTGSHHPAFVVYGDGEELLGYLLGQSIPPEGDLLRIAVDPHARRTGVAKLLLDAFTTYLKENGCTVCYLDVRDHNLPAQTLYTAHGFAPIDRRKSYYRLPTEDAIVMRCDLDAKEPKL